MGGFHKNFSKLSRKQKRKAKPLKTNEEVNGKFQTYNSQK